MGVFSRGLLDHSNVKNIMALPKLLVTAILLALATAEPEYRLPTYATPSSYVIDIEIDPEQVQFNGTVTINLDVDGANTDADIQTLQLHADHDLIMITKVTLNDKDQCTASVIDNVTDIVTLNCNKNLDGSQVIKIDYVGNLSIDDMYGLYRSTYTEDGKNKTLVATQFEQTYARRAWPNFDEPRFKADWTLTVTAPKKYTVVSNTKIQDTNIVGDAMVTKFSKTPVMSSYLVALVVSEFTSIKSTVKEDYDFSVIARVSAENYTKTAVKYGPLLIDLMGNWTNISYTELGNSKQDLAAIPDFSAGAMENWGLITYREIDLLDEDDKTTNSAKQTVITVIAHELAHQWFGDYVTTQWWSETWLNEGFASYFEFFNANNLPNESLGLDYQFVVKVHQSILQVDDVPSAAPLSSKDADVNSPAEADKKFDDITYDKGGSVIRMIKYAIGEEVFQEGLRNYLKSNRYQVVSAHELLSSLDPNSTDLAEKLSSWIYEPGYPILKASLNMNGSVVLENNKRFLKNAEKDTNQESIWYVPVSYTKSGKPDFMNLDIQWLAPKETSVIDLDDGEWILFNIQSSGFYRVNYDQELWSRIISVLMESPDQIHVLNRAQVLDDIFNIAKIGDIDYNTTFKLSRYISKETEYYPLYTYLTEISYLLGKLQSDDTKNQLVAEVLMLLDDVINEALTSSSENLSHVEVLKKVLILTWASKLGHSDALSLATQQFESYKNDTNSIVDNNLRNIIFCYGLKNSANANDDFDFLYNVYLESNSPNEKIDILNSLACVKDKDVLKNYLAKTIDDNAGIRKQDAQRVFRAVYNAGPEGIDVALDFLSANVDTIVEKYKGMLAIDSILTGLGSVIVKDDNISKLQAIITDNSMVESIQVSGKQALDIASANKKWSEEHEGDVAAALFDDSPSSGNLISSVSLVSIASVFIVAFLF
ncbi:aminopeptidase N-like [Cylas formicarius]|uniref:aminopeptidase N-like n=1 Tax=Cylas formicarius TaxID=197179 RepID=UPI002958DAE3|nr:aminopeptidase N-like [Cylas formicarius]XP_060525054.1 aminopeptidase N-like [Cylas formicarius]